MKFEEIILIFPNITKNYIIKHRDKLLRVYFTYKQIWPLYKINIKISPLADFSGLTTT